MASSTKAQELRSLVGLAIKLRALAEETDDLTDMELFLSAALTLEDRAHRIAFGTAAPETAMHQKIDITC